MYFFSLMQELTTSTSWRTKSFLNTESDIFDTLCVQNKILKEKRSKWFCWKICNVVTQKREFVALHSIKSNALLNTILQPSKTARYPSRSVTLEILSQSFVDHMKLRHNPSQVIGTLLKFDICSGSL